MQFQKAQRVPNKVDARRLTPRHIIIKMPKIKDKERILKAEREKETVTYRGVPIRLSVKFSKETLQAGRVWQKYSKSCKAGTYIQDCSIQQNYHLVLKDRERASQTIKI